MCQHVPTYRQTYVTMYVCVALLRLMYATAPRGWQREYVESGEREHKRGREEGSELI